MARQVRYEYGVVAKREESRVQAPKNMVQTAPMQKNDSRFVVIKRFAARRGKDLFSTDIEIHDQPLAVRFAARNPISKSALMSVTSSRPTESRIMSSLMPAASSASASIRECVVVAG